MERQQHGRFVFQGSHVAVGCSQVAFFKQQLQGLWRTPRSGQVKG
jgi:hypothetical protein